MGLLDAHWVAAACSQEGTLSAACSFIRGVLRWELNLVVTIKDEAFIIKDCLDRQVEKVC